MTNLSGRFFSLFALAAAMIAAGAAQAGEERPGAAWRDGNALWMRRHWLHEEPGKDEIAALAASLRERGISRIYPFLGPMDGEGWPGWRSKSGHRRYMPERAGPFLAEIHRIAPEIRVIPWTGGNLGADVHLEDEAQRKAFAAHARRLIELGADGVQLNIEPLRSGAEAYLTLLREVKTAIGKRTLSVAAYPPPALAESDLDTHWDPSFMRKVCRIADELAIMAYNTGLVSASAFEGQVSAWTRQLAGSLPGPEAGGCEWRMGVPSYDDDKDYHRPDVETIEHSLMGIMSGLRGIESAGGFRGIAIYASFTTDERKWAVYGRLWLGNAQFSSPPPDPRNTAE